MPLFLYLKHFPSFTSRDFFSFKFRGIWVRICQSELNKRKKKVLLWDISTQEKLVITFKEILAIICTIIEDLAFFLIWFVAFICL